MAAVGGWCVVRVKDAWTLCRPIGQVNVRMWRVFDLHFRLLNTWFGLVAVLEEINERVQWLEEMEALGEGKKHRATIQLQIAEKLNELKRLDRAKSQENEI